MKKNILYLAGVMALCTSCSSDFLERAPLDGISDATYWKTENDLKIYATQFYQFQNHRMGGWSSKYSVENGTDNVLGLREIGFPTNQIFNRNTTADGSSWGWNNNYANLRKVNYMIGKVLENYDLNSMSDDAKHYLGEAYFFRAFLNYELLRNFGGCPFVDKVLSPEDEESMYQTRMSRDAFARKIVDDLDTAIGYLQNAGKGAAEAGRITKEAALGYKMRYALFEGSWEYYHKGTEFGVDGKDGSEFLQDVINAGDELISLLGNNIYVGPAGQEYWAYFNKKDYSKVPGALHYQLYSKALGRTNIWANYFRGGGQLGLTKSVVDDYLMKDGTPIELAGDKYKGDDTFVDQTTDRDPRLEQTIYFNEKWGPFSNLTAWPAQSNITMTSITQACYGVYYYIPTGYNIVKGGLPDINEYSEYGYGEQGWMYLRYEEALLSYAEAKAILGTITQEDLDKTVNVVRSRVGVAPMDLEVVKAWDANPQYFKRYGSEVNSVINEIRRERRVELVCEGIRYDDIRRWRALGTLIKGWIPRGAKAQQFLDFYTEENNAKAGDGRGVLNPGDVAIDSKGYLLPMGIVRPNDFAEGAPGCVIDEHVHYLWSIPRDQILLYETKGVTLEQNPGWN